MKRTPWPLLLIALPAAVAIWSGWVGLGELCGFGPVRLLPGITDWTLNTAITLPVGVEAYAAYALGAWMSPGSPPAARTFAKRSALGALAYGMAGQIIYHLLASSHAVRAPAFVVVVVSCMPVAVLGLAAALTHLLRRAPDDEPSTLSDAPEPAAIPAPVAAPVTASERTRTRRTRSAPDPLTEFADEIATGALPSRRQVMKRMHVGQDKADGILVQLRDFEPAAMVGAVNGNGVH